ncbi:MAG: hypothetical protein K2Q33_01360 [Gammaproteobacteria bacterium]|nr:hypothetical protein [Gammaproteobacteria bacterium]
MTFKPGKSGNPSGRPIGVKNRYKLYHDAVAGHCDELIGKGLEMAKNGNEQMLKLFLERILPPKPRGVEITIPNLQVTDSLSKQGEQLLAAYYRGDLNSSEVQSSIELLLRQAQLHRETDLAQQLEALQKELSLIPK